MISLISVLTAKDAAKSRRQLLNGFKKAKGNPCSLVYTVGKLDQI